MRQLVKECQEPVQLETWNSFSPRGLKEEPSLLGLYISLLDLFQIFGLQSDEIIDFCGFKAFGL